MNVSQSIFTAPNNFEDKERESPNSTSPTTGKRAGTLSTTRFKRQNPSYSTEPQPAHVRTAISEPFQPTQSATWPSNLRGELVQQFDERASTTGKKRASSRVSPHLSTASGPPPSKKADRRHRSRRELHSSTLVPTSSEDSLPQGPLFFSHQKSKRPSLPYRLSSSEAGAKMLSKASKEDTGGVRTLKLARGSMNAGSPSRPLGARTPSGSGRSYLGLSHKTKSPGNGDKSNGLNTLNQIGVTELLEQDERPTFILDLGDQHNFEPGHLKILFANASLRALPPILDLITGISGQESPSLTATTSFSDFKAWAVSFVKEHESLDVALPSFFYAGATWTTCSLRKRFRVIKGALGSAKASLASHPPSVGFPSTSSIGKENDIFVDTRTEREEAIEE